MGRTTPLYKNINDISRVTKLIKMFPLATEFDFQAETNLLK